MHPSAKPYMPPTQEPTHPLLALLLLVLLVFGGMCLGFFVAMLVVLGLYSAELHQGLPAGAGALGLLNQISAVLARPQDYPAGWGILMIMQGIPLLLGFGGGAAVLLRLPNFWRNPHGWADVTPRRTSATWLLAAVLLIVVSVPAMSVLIAWNAGLHLPSSLYSLEKAARLYEDQAQTLTAFLTKFTSPGRFLVAVLVVAIIPAIAEELTFRGVVLRQLARWTNSLHWGVWLSAIIFSAIHVQFFGFFPRMILGVLLGYLFVWSGNIRVSMAAHFAQNFFQLLLIYLQQRGSIQFNADANEALPWTWALGSLLVTAGLLYWLYQQRATPLLADAPAAGHTLSAQGVRAATAPPAGHTLSSHGVDQPADGPAR